jgi:MFS family permease
MTILTSAPMNAADAGPDRASFAAWYALAILVLTTLFAFLDRQILNLVAPSLQTSLGLSDLQLGALQGLGMAIFASIASYPVGWLADHFGRRLLLSAGVAIWTLSTAACAFQHSFAGLFLCTIGIAVGEAGLRPIVFAMIPDLFPERRRNAANFLYFAAALLGAAAGLGLGGLTLQWLTAHRQAMPGALGQLDAWRVALLIVAAPGPLFVVLVATIRAPLRQGASLAQHADPDSPVAEFLPFARENWPLLGCVFGAIACYSVPLMSASVWLPIAVPRLFGVPSSSVGLSMGIALGVGTVVGILLPAIGMKMGRRDIRVSPLRLAGMFTGLAAIPGGLIFLSNVPWHAYLAAGAQLCAGVATAALMPGLLQNIAPVRLRARMLSVLGIVTAIAQGLSPLLVGWLSGQFSGPRGIFHAMAGVAVPAWLLSALLYRIAMRLLREQALLDRR